MGRSLGIAAAAAGLALALPFVFHFFSPREISISPLTLSLPLIAKLSATPEAKPFTCEPHAYTTEIISLDPLLVYIHEFLSSGEISALLAAGEAEFAPSEVTKHNQKVHTADRTSQSAGLPLNDTAVQCVLKRAEGFMGTMLDPARDEIGPPQLVRYTAGQRFNIHHDWYERPQPARRDKLGKGRSWNRVASFFAVLEDGCTGGATHFPYIKPPGRVGKVGQDGRTWYERDEKEGGGIAFRPVKGNALFWVNLHANGTGDERVMHAGLPLDEGLKTAMNIWPRQYYP